jgi:hypothetical protein
MEGYPSVHPDEKDLSSSDIPPEKNSTVEAWPSHWISMSLSGCRQMSE